MWLDRIYRADITFVPSPEGGFRLFTPKNIDPALLAAVQDNKADIVAELNGSLRFWIDTALSAESNEAINDILDSFRPLPWNDQQRADMARACDRRRHALNF